MSEGQHWSGTSQGYYGGDDQRSFLGPGVTVNKSCDLCSAKKRKCDGGNPCSRCVRRGEGHNCSYSIRRPYTPRRGSRASGAAQPSVGHTMDATPSLQPGVPGRFQEGAVGAFSYNGTRAQTGSAESLSMTTSNPSAWNTSGASLMGGSLGGQGHLRGLTPDAAAHGHPSSYAVGATGSGRYPNATWGSQWSNPGALARDNGVAGAYAHSQPMMLHPSGAGAYTSYQGGGVSANTNVAMTSAQAANYAQRNNAAAMMGDDDVAEEDWLEATKAFAL